MSYRLLEKWKDGKMESWKVEDQNPWWVFDGWKGQILFENRNFG